MSLILLSRRRGGASGGGGGAEHSIFTNAPSAAAGWQTVFDFGAWTAPLTNTADLGGFRAINRPVEGTTDANFSVGTDAAQPGGGTTPGFLRTTFPTSLPGGFAPAAFYYNGSFPTTTTDWGI